MRPADISKYENGTMSPGPDRLATLAGSLAIKPTDLVIADELGYGLKALRAAAGFTQAALADAAGPDMTVSRLKSLELGKVRRLTHADTDALAAALGATFEAVRAAHQWDLDHAGN
jgi:transcriptional regulator with XRE-family HTH domain